MEWNVKCSVESVEGSSWVSGRVVASCNITSRTPPATIGSSFFRYLPSGYVKIAIENHHRNSEFSHEKW